ncbi:MAG: hypothetical protein ACI4U4_01640 [Bacilli bacterium]
MKKKVLFIIAIIFSFFGLSFFGVFFYFYINPIEMEIDNFLYEDKFLSFEVYNVSKDAYCIVTTSDDVASLDNNYWYKISDNKCKYRLDKLGNYNVFVKNNNEITKLDISKTFDIYINKKTYYLALGDNKDISYSLLNIGSGNVSISSKNEKVVSVKENNVIANGVGSTKIVISGDGVSKEITIVVTDLIDKMSKKYNYDREYLSCDTFSSKEANLLDRILFDRVRDAGEGTRAGVVAAARFLTLEFPYRISYFSENGRLANYNGGRKVDGEGRFYHKGLYLDESKFAEIEYSDKGPNPWGCMIYSRPSKGMRANGLDCSGFTTWAIYNGGFDVEDLGAFGGDSSIYNLNEVGEEVTLTREVALSGKIKAGDLLGEVSVSEGHSALVIGVDSNNYYVAESLWISPLGLNVNTYKKSELSNYFETVNLMDSYYKKNGNYTAMWY